MPQYRLKGLKVVGPIVFNKLLWYYHKSQWRKNLSICFDIDWYYHLMELTKNVARRLSSLRIQKEPIYPKELGTKPIRVTSPKFWFQLVVWSCPPTMNIIRQLQTMPITWYERHKLTWLAGTPLVEKEPVRLWQYSSELDDINTLYWKTLSYVVTSKFCGTGRHIVCLLWLVCGIDLQLIFCRPRMSPENSRKYSSSFFRLYEVHFFIIPKKKRQKLDRKYQSKSNWWIRQTLEC